MAMPLLCALPVSEVAKADLARRMIDPSRHYHTLDHLELLWTRHQEYREAAEVRDPLIDRLIVLAITYHDVIYVGGAADNEARSADLWLEVGAELGDLDESDKLWVADTIRATANHLESPRPDISDARHRARQWVLDLDLTPLGEAPAIFDRNMELLAAEVPHLPARDQRAGLNAAIRHFAAARPLYRSPTIANVFDAVVDAVVRAAKARRRLVEIAEKTLKAPQDLNAEEIENICRFVVMHTHCSQIGEAGQLDR